MKGNQIAPKLKKKQKQEAAGKKMVSLASWQTCGQSRCVSEKHIASRHPFTILPKRK